MPIYPTLNPAFNPTHKNQKKIGLHFHELVYEEKGQMSEFIKIPISQEAKKNLLDNEGITVVHDELTYELREATLREVNEFTKLEEENRGGEQVAWFGKLLHKRVREEKVYPQITMEILLDVSPTKLAALVESYLTGNEPDEKKAKEATKMMLSGLMAKMLTMNSGPMPSPVISMDSAEKK